MGEFELIRHFFQQHRAETMPGSVFLGIGDDAALLQPPDGQTLVVSVDTLVCDVHFPADAAPDEIAQRALRVNLSDLAAMGAQPLWFTLALTLPEVSDDWLRDFSRGLFACAEEFDCTLVGGDTTSGPLSITIQVMGTVEPSRALRRDGAGAGDYVLVTHTLGDAAAGLAVMQDRLDQTLDEPTNAYLSARYYQPTPRLKEGVALRDFASAALDISDGLVADLGHIGESSDLGADVYVEDLPLSPALKRLKDKDQARRWALAGGDDYELCFTVAEEKMPELGLRIASGEIDATVIGRMRAGSGVSCLLQGQPFELESSGYTHF
ncbi:thiamine-phosphate kinase [Marinimicrobium sp. C2-29]|uniref:thiamine-phosphate kinase n=1 Tax=Marinimicrobium sp. C2-29 TaxID=3139825 RepID=UPI0031389F3D